MSDADGGGDPLGMAVQALLVTYHKSIDLFSLRFYRITCELHTCFGLFLVFQHKECCLIGFC